MQADTSIRALRGGTRLWAAVAALAIVASVIGVVALPSAASASPGGGIAVGTSIVTIGPPCVGCADPWDAFVSIPNLQLTGAIPVGGKTATSLHLKLYFRAGVACAASGLIPGLEVQQCVLTPLLGGTTDSWQLPQLSPGPTGPAVTGSCNFPASSGITIAAHLATLPVTCQASIGGTPPAPLNITLALPILPIEGGLYNGFASASMVLSYPTVGIFSSA